MIARFQTNTYMSAIGGPPDHRWSPQSGHPWKAFMSAMDVSIKACMYA